MELPNGNVKPVTEQINHLYIMTRFKYLWQTDIGEYVTLDKTKSRRVIPLVDDLIEKHLEGERTYGIFGGTFSKFMTFDVDCQNESTAKWATYKLIDTLTEQFSIMYDDIHVSYSGSKGYHVDLFFDRPVLVRDLQKFYRAVTVEVGDIPDGQIEFRPTWGQGVKLPLGIHRKTNKRCWYVDKQSLRPLEGFDYIMAITPMSADTITDNDFELTNEQAAEMEHVMRTVDPDVNVISMSDALQRAGRIIKTGKLTKSGTRHNTTVLLAAFFNAHGYEKDEAIDAIMTILHNTPRSYFSRNSTPEHWAKETKRLVGLAFDRNYQLGNENQEVRVYKSEILSVLQASTFKTKQMLFSMLITSKRYGKTFYFARSTAKEMLGTNSNATVITAIARLEESKLIEVISRKEVDKGASLEKGHVVYKPNKYRLLIAEPADDEPFITVNNDTGIATAARELCDEKEIKQYVKRHEFKTRFAVN